MSHQIAAGETEPLLTEVPRYDVSNSNDIYSAHPDRVDSCVPEETCTPVSDNRIQVFKRRWYILILYSLVNVMQSMIWNTWGPLALSAQIAFGWSLDEIALLTNWGCIMYALSTFFFSWLMDVKGLRWACLCAGGLVAVGSALRCISDDPYAAKWFFNGGQLVNGLAGPVFMAAPPLISATWFPASQRTTATSLAILSGNVGFALAFIIGPLMVPDNIPPSNIHNETFQSESLDWNIHQMVTHNDSTQAVLSARRHIMRLMYVECAWSCLLFVVMILYFPAKPPAAPSISATVDRVDFFSGLKQLLQHRTFWKIAVCYALSNGVCDEWLSLIEPIMNDAIKRSGGSIQGQQVKAGWLGFSTSIATGIGGFLIGRVSDVFVRRMKHLLVMLFTVSLFAIIAFALDTSFLIPFNIGYVYAGYVITSIGVGSCSPLFYELACESTYPVAEGVTNGLLTWLNNVVGLTFLFVLMRPNIGTQWMNWTLAGCVAVCIPVLLLHRVRYNRLDVDIPDVNAVSRSSSANDIASQQQHRMTVNADIGPD